MKQLALLIVFCLSQLAAFAIAPNTQEKLAAHLLEINPEWKYYLQSERYAEPVQFESDAQRISRHLVEVCHLLETNNARYSADEQTVRTKLIAQLRDYARNEVFPVNTAHSRRIPYFIDDYGTACAVGYLMLCNGFETEALLVKREMNTAYIREIPSNWLKGWMDFGALSIDELALIQPAYSPNTVWENLGNDITSGQVNSLLVHEGEMLLGGEFELDGNPVFLAAYESENLMAWPVQPNGPVMDMIEFNGQLWIAGSFNGYQQDVAVWENGAWDYQNAAMGKTAQGYALGIHSDQLYLSSSMSGFAGFDFFVYRLDGDYWLQEGQFNMPVYAFLSNGVELLVAGAFTELITTMGPEPMAHVASSTNGSEWVEKGAGLQLPIHSLELFDGKLIASGELFFEDSEDVHPPKYFDEGNWVDLIAPEYFTAGDIPEMEKGIFAAAQSADRLFYAGNFMVSSFGSFGADCFELNIIEFEEDEIVFAEALIGWYEGVLRTSIVWNEQLYVAGSYSGENENQSAFMRTDFSSSIPVFDQAEFALYPNPANSVFSIRYDQMLDPVMLRIYDSSARLITEQRLSSQNTEVFDLSGNAPGMYSVLLFGEGDSYLGMKRLILE